MRVIADLKSHFDGDPKIIQVERIPSENTTGTAINGKFMLPILDGVDFPIDQNDYILPVDGGDLSSISYAHLLASYPMFGHVYFNPLLIDTDVDDLDLTATFRAEQTPPAAPIYHPTRCQTGRESTSLLDTGLVPNNTALLPQNNAITPAHPGILISQEIDLTPYTGAIGTDEFMLYWKLYSFQNSHDVAADFGLLSGSNTPAFRDIHETSEEPSGLSAYISPDNGVHWCSTGYLEPIAFTTKTTAIRLAFKNTGTAKVYLSTFGVLF